MTATGAASPEKGETMAAPSRHYRMTEDRAGPGETA